MRLGWLQLGMVALCALWTSSEVRAESTASAASQVRLGVLVVEGTRQDKTFDSRIDPKVHGTLQDMGYTGARVLDALDTTVDKGSSVSLEILGKSGKSRVLKVTVLKIIDPQTVKLRVAIPEFKFSTDSISKKSGTLLLAFKTTEGKAMFLAVTPSL